MPASTGFILLKGVSIFLTLTGIVCANAWSLERLNETYEKVQDPYIELGIPNEIKEFKSGNCFPVMCKFFHQDYNTLRFYGMGLQDIVELKVCTQIVVEAEDYKGNINLQSLESPIFTHIQQLRLNQTKSFEPILLVNYPFRFPSYPKPMHPNLESNYMQTKIFDLMRTFNFTGLHLTLTNVVPKDSKSHEKFINIVQTKIQKYKQICDGSNWTFDVTIKHPFSSFIDDVILGNIKRFTRYLVLAYQWDRNPGDPWHLLPLYGPIISLEQLLSLRNSFKFNTENIFFEISLHALTFKYKNNIFKNKETSLNTPLDVLTDVNNLVDVLQQNYRFVCRNALSVPGTNLFTDTSAGSVFLHDRDRNLFTTTETTQSLHSKIQFMIKNGIRGFSFASILSDDISGIQCPEQFPLLKTISYALSSSNKCHDLNSNGNDSINEILGVNLTSPNNHWQIDSATFVLYAVSTMSTLALIFTWIVLVLLYLRHIARRKAENCQSKAVNDLFLLEVPEHEYRICSENVIGTGNFTFVFKGKLFFEDVAVKIPKRNTKLKLSVHQQLKEVEILRAVNGNSNIVGLLGISTKLIDSGYIYQFLEYCPLGPLDIFLKQNRHNFVNDFGVDRGEPSAKTQTDTSYVMGKSNERLDFRKLISWTYQISEGMEYVSSKSILHGDLAAKNVLLHSLDCIKICDFGSARYISSTQNNTEDIVDAYQLKLNTEYIPWRWMAVECLEKYTICLPSDVWSFGVTVWEIFSLGEVPFARINCRSELQLILQTGSQLPKPKYITTNMHENFIKPCWSLSPDDRPDFADLKTKLSSFIQAHLSEGYEV